MTPDLTDEQRVVSLVADGTISAEQGAQMIAALKRKATPPPVAAPAAKAQTAGPEISLQRPDGSHYTVQVPPNLLPMVLKLTGVAIKESARTASREAWDGLKAMTRRKTAEIRSDVKSRMSGGAPAAAPTPGVDAAKDARQRILNLLAEGKVSADQARRLLDQIDAGMSK